MITVVLPAQKILMPVGTPDTSPYYDTCMWSLVKHLYTWEKPVGNSIVECRTMSCGRSNVILKVGAAALSNASSIPSPFGADFAQTDTKLGNIRTVKVWRYSGMDESLRAGGGELSPAGVDYKQWLGPAITRILSTRRLSS